MPSETPNSASHERQLPQPVRPISLEYGGPDLPTDLHRQVDAIADDYGGTAQVLQAVAWGVAAALISVLVCGAWGRFDGSYTCLGTFTGVIAFGLGIFLPVADRDAYARAAAGVAMGVAVGGIGALMCVPRGGLLFSTGGFWLGWTWMDQRQRRRDGL